MNQESRIKNHRLATAVFATVILASYFVIPVTAQTPTQVVLTWQANNFYRADFEGKALVTPGTPVTVSAEVLNNGKFTDLSGANFIWYVDEKLYSRGENLKDINFVANKTTGDNYFVRVSIRSGENNFESSLRVPVSNPVVTLKAPYPNGLVKSGEKAQVTAVPYFFNVGLFQNLEFFWQIEGGTIKGSGNDNNLTLNIGSAEPGKTIQVTGTTRNKSNPIETAISRIKLIVY